MSDNINDEDIDKQIDTIVFEIMDTIDKKFCDIDKELIMAAFGRCVIVGGHSLKMDAEGFQEFLFHVESEFIHILKGKGLNEKMD